ncbi:MAG: bifunctional metallophosphatase/5'-nucleotidase [Pseudomonadota bacterium]|nr:bifunctional metallophosphatase/5'-nucleotidase [Pseudomonadota bacterium]
MRRRLLAAAALLFLAGCVTAPVQPPSPPAAGPVEIQILGINDFHGNLEPPTSPVERVEADGTKRTEPLGGAGFLASTLAGLRAGQQNSITVAAGDLIGASPFTSANFLDEPTILAMNAMGLDYNAVGNHEFDKGSAELLRMQNGGCGKYGTRVPCQVDTPFSGARFRFLAANVLKEDGSTLFSGTAIKDFGPVQVGIIGMTLKETATLVTPAGVAGLTFADEAATANALVPKLKAAGADLVMLVLHQGGRTPGVFNVTGCPGLEGDILPILDALDPAVSIVVSGHTHQAYACERPARDGSARLLTSAGRYGYFVTDIRVRLDPTGQRIAASARNVPVTRDRAQDSAVERLVERYAAAAAPAALRVVGRLSGPAPHSEHDDETPAANLIADAQLAASRAPGASGAQVAFMNGSGVRTDLIPDGGNVRYGQIFEMQPFGNGLVVMTLSGEQIRRMLEQQFADDSYEPGARPSLLVPSEGFRFDYDLSRPQGQRIVAASLNGRPIDAAASYRVTVNSFLASGGDGFTVLTEGRERRDAGLDLDALEAWLAPGREVPKLGRTRNLTRS